MVTQDLDNQRKDAILYPPKSRGPAPCSVKSAWCRPGWEMDVLGRFFTGRGIKFLSQERKNRPAEDFA
ncbi:hypothetical protein TH25_22535 [Thalassospira profundimaris]|uniref:Uncharacterized protein n=1 Tax=Thalassospira profundimaris TaxID=502049 RepID=A0A367WQ39_9PROT|nr:hypothetical protein TH25_22535 [Thalassospira profundimaris]